MQQNEYTENLFRSVDTIVAERIKNLSYDYTQLMEITDDNNANAGMYKVKLNSNTDVVAYADNPSYQIGDQVYVLNTGDGDRRFILGTFLKNSTGRIDRSNSDLLKLQNDVNNLSYSTEDLKASLLILPEQVDLKLQALNEKIISTLQLNQEKINLQFLNTEAKLSSSFEITAEMLRTEFYNETDQLHSTFLQTAGIIQTQVRDEANERWSRITQTADEIKSEVSDEVNGLYSAISQTAGEIRNEVHDEVNGLNSLIDQTAGEILLQVTDDLNGQRAALDVLANGITARVEDMEQGYSEISQTADKISSRVESLYGNYSQILQTADMINSRVEGLYSNYSEIKQTADMISSRVQGIEGNYSELIQTADMISSRVEDVNGYASTIEQTAKSIKLSVDNPDENGKSSTIHLLQDGIEISSSEINFDGLVSFSNLSGKVHDKRTIIDGGYISAHSITAEQISADQFNVKIDGNGNEWHGKAGFLGYGQGHDGRDITHGVMLAGPGGDNYFIATTSGVRMTCGSASNSPSFYVGSNGAHVTNASLFVKGNQVVTSSDRNIKNNISYNLEKYHGFYNLLQPAYYKYNDGTSNRYHLGFIYQDVEQALLKNDLTSQDFAGLVKNHNLDDGEVECGLRYEEFISLNTYMIQKTRKELKEKDNKIQQLENKVNELEQKLNLLLETLS